MTNKSKEYLEKVRNEIEHKLKRQRIVAVVKIEKKHLYNIYMKMQKKKIKMEEIRDLFAIKIITKDKSSCYKILGIINQQYNLIAKSFKDYIATPRNNRYQAIHEMIVIEPNIILEVQICSYHMNQIAKYGIANYFPYMKQGKIEIKQELDFKKNLSGIHDSLELENIIENPKEFLSTLKNELLDDEVYIFTPKGDIKVLPRGATAIDFAYSIHNDIGNHMIGCKINNIEMPIMTKLKNGNIVEIETSNHNIVPQEEWLKQVKTAKAKSALIKLIMLRKNKNYKEQVVQIKSIDKKGLVLEIVRVFSKYDINILSLKTELIDENANIDILIEKEEKENLDKLTQELMKIDNIFNIRIYDNSFE